MAAQPPKMTRLECDRDGRLSAIVDPGPGFDLARIDLGPIAEVDPFEMIPPGMRPVFYRELAWWEGLDDPRDLHADWNGTYYRNLM